MGQRRAGRNVGPPGIGAAPISFRLAAIRYGIVNDSPIDGTAQAAPDPLPTAPPSDPRPRELA